MENLKVISQKVKNNENRDCCSLCFDDGYSLNELTESDNSTGVIKQANLLLKLGNKITDVFCEECFWK